MRKSKISTVLGFCRDRISKRFTYIYIYIRKFIIKKFHVIIEAWKSQDLPFASWRTRRDGDDVIQFFLKGLTMGSWGTRPGLSQKTQEQGAPMFESKRGWLFPFREREFAILSPYSTQALNGLWDAHLHWWRPSFLFNLLIQMLISPWNLFTSTPRKS